MKNYEQLFIIGAPRSGTTYLASLLEHSRFRTPIETHYIVKYWNRLINYQPIKNQKNLSRLIKKISKERPIQQHNLKLDPIEISQSLTSNNTYYQLVNEINVRLVKNETKNSWGDKTPHYLRNLETLIKIFPDAYYIFIVRDGRDVALSLLEKPWGPNNVFSCASYWAELNENFINHRNKIPNEKLLCIKYEELISQPSKQITEIFNFINEDREALDNALASFTKPKSRNSEKWKAKLSLKQKKIFEAEAGSTLQRFNYECEYKDKKPTTSFVMVQIYKLHDRILRYNFLIKHNIIDGLMIKLFGKQPFNE